MKNYIENIGLINAYLDKMLSKTERLSFENRLKNDAEFKQLYREQLAILEGVNRVGLKVEINAAKQSYVRAKWMRYVGVSVGVVLVSALIYSLIFKSETSQITESTNSIIKTVSDSIILEKTLENKAKEIVLPEKLVDSVKKRFTVVKRIVETIEDKELTKAYGGVKYMREVETLEDLGRFTRQEFNEFFPELKHLKSKRDTVFIESRINKAKYGYEEVAIKNNLNSKNEAKELKAADNELITFFKTVKKTPQIIEVNTEKDFKVTCREGTILTIPAKSFVDVKTGKLARGKINLEVIEYYKLSDMLLGNLTTKSDDKQLETGGMLCLEANKRGTRLKLKPGRKIQMIFNNKGKTNMQLFSGEENDEGVNWKLENKAEDNSLSIKDVPVVKLMEEDVTVHFQSIEYVPIYPGCESENNNDRRKCMSDAVDKLVKRKFNTSIAENLSLSGKQRIYSSFEIDEKGNIGKISVRAPAKQLGDETIRILELIPQLVPGKQNNKPVKTSYNLVFTITLEGETVSSNNSVTVKSDRRFTESFEKRVDSIKATNGILATISNNDIQRYSFSSSNLGWINCDRFVNSKKSKVKFKLKIKDTKGTNVKLVFKNISSILPSKKNADEFDFGNIPIDEEVVVIAIKKTKDKLFLAKEETTIKAKPKLNLEFKEVSIQELKKELENLSDSF